MVSHSVAHCSTSSVASAANPSGYNGMLYLVSALGILGLFFSFMLWRTEKGPQAHGLETIKAKT